MKIYALLLGILLTAGCATLSGPPAPSIDGKWAGTFAGGMGGQPMELDYEFISEGYTLKGSATGGPGDRIEIQNGKIEGNNISFDVPVEMGQMKMTVKYTGVLSGDELKLSFIMEMEGGPPGGGMGGPGGGEMPPNEFTATRVIDSE